MKITLAPIASRASGRFGGLVASNWRGIDLVRIFAKPAYKNTADQLAVRNIFRNLTHVYSEMSTYWKDAWDNQALGKKYQGRNHLLGLNVKPLQTSALLADMVGTPGDASTSPPVAFDATPSSGQISLAFTVPSLPPSWTITRCIAVCMRDLDYKVLQYQDNVRPTEGMDATAPYVVVLTGLVNSVLYRCFGWIEWADPTGVKRHSTSRTTTSTPTA